MSPTWNWLITQLVDLDPQFEKQCSGGCLLLPWLAWLYLQNGEMIVPFAWLLLSVPLIITELNWVQFKVLVITFNALKSLGPGYLKDCLSFRKLVHNLRSFSFLTCIPLPSEVQLTGVQQGLFCCDVQNVELAGLGCHSSSNAQMCTVCGFCYSNFWLFSGF